MHKDREPVTLRRSGTWIAFALTTSLGACGIIAKEYAEPASGETSRLTVVSGPAQVIVYLYDDPATCSGRKVVPQQSGSPFKVRSNTLQTFTLMSQVPIGRVCAPTASFTPARGVDYRLILGLERGKCLVTIQGSDGKTAPLRQREWLRNSDQDASFCRDDY